MKKGFTLIELLVVIAILGTLMAMVFKIGNIGGESEKRSVTIQRMQRLENALSGYYAAFGMYPPVRVHGSRNIYLRVDDQGRQSEDDENTSFSDQGRMWNQVQAACRSQPVGCEFPFGEGWKMTIQSASDGMPSEANCSFDDGVSQNIGRHAKNKDKTEWSKIKLFKFGLMSYLLPRYLIMMNGDDSFFTDYAQWTGNNTEPADAMTGQKMTWRKIQDYTGARNNNQNVNKRDLVRVANIPSQAVCARWMSSFENSLCCNDNRQLFGINIKSSTQDSTMTAIPYWDEDYKTVIGRHRIYYPDGYNGSDSGGYILDAITMNDGWGNEFYYYSPSPHQSYTVWSSGPNGKTFAPWISREQLDANANRIVGEWIKDDIVSQSN